MVTVQLAFAEDSEDLTIAHAWPEVTSPEVRWPFPVLFFRIFPYFFVLFSRNFFPVFFISRTFPRLFPVFFSRTFSYFFSPYFFLSSSTKCWLGRSLRRSRPIAFYELALLLVICPFPAILFSLSASYNLIIFYELALLLIICPFPAILFS
jgi:hypothetical protein